MTKSSSKKANSEQERAIFHRGGKLLSAGAGSGKTFVLIEHIVYLLSEIKIKSNKADYQKAISTFLSKIVLMTFTKKAAGEMSVRMMKKIDELIENAEETDENEFWILVRQNLSYFAITTIHGFCHRLLSLGLWNEFPQNIDLVSKIEHEYKIQKIFDMWFAEKQKNLDSLFIASAKALQSSMVEIFSSPELRALWSKPRLPKDPEVEINHFFSELLAIKGYGDLFETSIDLVTEEKEKKKKWYELLLSFNELILTNGKINFSNYIKYQNFFKSITRFPVTSSKEISMIQKISLDQIRELKDDLKEVADDLQSLTEKFEIYKKWIETISELFFYVERHYLQFPGFSFADLEYYVLRALENESVLQKIQESYSYFIVDEFQDTSFIQFQILKKLIGNNPEKLFCVGDKKQAIYGFRGGELQVFSECSQFLGDENNYFLGNNFRSFRDVIQFNNDLFSEIFPLGLKYEGLDPHTVKMESQSIPDSTLDLGEVLAIRTEVEIENDDDIELDKLEAELLAEHIESLLIREDLNTICILYRKLQPSAYLVDLFLKKDMAFSAQVKIQFNEDPIISMFIYLIELYLNRNDQTKSTATLHLLSTLLKVIGLTEAKLNTVHQFFEDIKIFGLMTSFNKFIYSLGITNSLYAQNLNVIRAICRLTKEDMAMAYHLLKNEESEEYACEMMSGSIDGKKRIIIMSAHASKGLEFDAVLLGGVHTNGRYNGIKDHIGKYPHSFKWKKAFDQKKFFKSPFYHLEADILKFKDFSESKRLLYVACTRAVKHLAYVDLWKIAKEAPKDLYLYDNSWIQALRLLETKKVEKKLSSKSDQKIPLPLLQQDYLGAVCSNLESTLGIVSELSVTRLATIAECPFKFYLQNICKIDGQDIVRGKQSLVEDADDDIYERPIFYSSKKRGTEIHYYLSQLFLGNISLDKIPTNEIEKITWSLSQGIKYKNDFEIISEKMIKFSFFGQMISGTPDLIFKNSKELILWDFKTGEREVNNEDAYWFQLMSYGYAYANLNHFTQDQKLKLALVYLDEKNLIEKEYSLDEITQILFNFWKKTESLNQVNLSHCIQCEYSSICNKGKTSTSL